MSNFLDLMAAASRMRLMDQRGRESFSRLRVRALATPVPPRLRPGGRFELIAEYKRRSPASGSFRHRDLVTQVTACGRAGAAAVSVLTEPAQFGGELSHLKLAADVLTPLGVPVMRKDFIIDPYQVLETRATGGSGVLLILRMLAADQLQELLDCAREMSLFVLLESFDEDDLAPVDSVLKRVASARDGLPVLLGVNCRDLRTLTVRPQRFLELAPRLPPDLPRVAESGIETVLDCAHVARAGFTFALVGSALMKSPDPARLVSTMLAAGRAA